MKPDDSKNSKWNPVGAVAMTVGALALIILAGLVLALQGNGDTQAVPTATRQPTVVPTITIEAGLTAEEYYEMCEDLYLSRQHESAIRLCTQAISLSPEYSSAFHTRANSYAALDQHEQALPDYDEALALDPDEVAIYPNRGDAHLALEQYDEALADYDRAIAAGWNFSELYLNRGRVYAAYEDYELALADYSYAISRTPEYADVFRYRGDAYYALEQFDSALSDYRRYVELTDGTGDPSVSERIAELEAE